MPGVAIGRADSVKLSCHVLSRGFAALPAGMLLGPLSLVLGLIFGFYAWDWIHPANEARSLSRSERYPVSTRNEPFGVLTNTLSEGPIAEKWAGVQQNVRSEMQRVAECRGQRSKCVDLDVLSFLRIVETAQVRQGIARLGEVNRAINLAIRPVSDLANFGEADVWSAPLSTLARGSGDCEDYAIAKMVVLLEAGVPSQDLRLVILRDTVRAAEHAVLAVRQQGHWLILDNRTLVMVGDVELKGFQPVFIIDDDGARIVAS
jgi:predicted transglutaminase-like cysteine proteinase